jgi:hypothetical protein
MMSIMAPMTITRVYSESMPYASLITPDCSPRDNDYADDVSPLDTAKKISLVLSKGMISSKRDAAPKHLVPRPGTIRRFHRFLRGYPIRSSMGMEFAM